MNCKRMCAKERDEQCWKKKKKSCLKAYTMFHKIIAGQIESTAEPNKHRQPALHSHDHLKNIIRQREMD